MTDIILSFFFEKAYLVELLHCNSINENSKKKINLILCFVILIAVEAWLHVNMYSKYGLQSYLTILFYVIKNRKL